MADAHAEPARPVRPEIPAADWPEPVRRVAAVLAERGVPARPLVLMQNTRTAQMAADAIGCPLGAIVKSLIFAPPGERLALVMMSGDRRVDLTQPGAVLGAADVKTADANSIKRRLGFVIGGVPPVGHAEPMDAYFDRSLLRFTEVWAAAGHQHSVFPITPDDLLRITGAESVDVAESVTA